ncbi:hypothetical protein AGMMS50229_17190 [Campylobacterota bacterium]|nr:hypothetical protein AGMMS50229_17190 [Campylobacterota bacterium]
MGRIIFLVEEKSMAVFLQGLLPRLFSMVDREHFLCIAHEGKSDLEKSIPKKLRTFRNQNQDDRFMIVRDNDGANCQIIKQRLLSLCSAAQSNDVLVRIACQELESWYLGDFSALEKVYGKCSVKEKTKKRFTKNPDAINSPSNELRRMFKSFEKIGCARELSQLLTEENNTSHSFHVLIDGIRRLSQQTGV